MRNLKEIASSFLIGVVLMAMFLVSGAWLWATQEPKVSCALHGGTIVHINGTDLCSVNLKKGQ